MADVSVRHRNTMGSISFYTPTNTGDGILEFMVTEGSELVSSKCATVYVPKEKAIEMMEEAIKLMKEKK